MLVDFKFPWFGPSEVVQKDKIQTISGKRYKRGVQEVDDSLKDILPKSVEILKHPPKKEMPKKEESLKDHDGERIDSDIVIKKAEDAEAEAKAAALKVKQDRMAKARAAKGARKGNKTVE